jgi:hypothetical protein
MDVQTAARVFHDWAVGEGLMDEPSAKVISSATELASINNVTDKGTEILRQKRVRAVGFNDALETVTVFTKRAAPISKKQKATLPDKVGDRLISYRQGVSQSINDGPPATLAGPVYAMRVQCTSSTPRASYLAEPRWPRPMNRMKPCLVEPIYPSRR